MRAAFPSKGREKSLPLWEKSRAAKQRRGEGSPRAADSAWDGGALKFVEVGPGEQIENPL